MGLAVPRYFPRNLTLYMVWFAILVVTQHNHAQGYSQFLTGTAFSVGLASVIAFALVALRLDTRIHDQGAVFVQTVLGIVITTITLYFVIPADRALLAMLSPLWLLVYLIQLGKRQVSVAVVINLLLYTLSQSSAIWGRDDIYYRSAITGFVVLTLFEIFIVAASRSIVASRGEQAEIIRQLANAREQVHRLTQQDPKTASLKVQYFMDMLRREKARVDRYGGVFSLALVEIDHFRALLETHGETVATQILLEFSERALKSVREMDVVEVMNHEDDMPSEHEPIGHINGARFAILLPATAFVGGMDCAERLHTSADMRTFRSAVGGVTVTLSLGVTEYRNGDTADDMLIRATHALLQAQKNGGNCVKGIKATRRH